MDAEKAEATYRNGMPELTQPKAEPAKGKTIAVHLPLVEEPLH